MTWTSLLLAGRCRRSGAFTRRSAVSLLIAALALGFAVLAAAARTSAPTRRARPGPAARPRVAAVLGSLVLRGSEPRHAEQLINAAGVAILVIPLRRSGPGCCSC